MTSSSPSLSKLDEAKSTATTLLWQVYHRRPRTQRAKAFALAAITFFLFLYMLTSSSRVSADRRSSLNRPSRHISRSPAFAGDAAHWLTRSVSNHSNPNPTSGPSSPPDIPFLNARKMRWSLFHVKAMSPIMAKAPMIRKSPVRASMSSFLLRGLPSLILMRVVSVGQ